MRVLGIDPGLTRCGWGVVEGRPGARPTALGVGVLRSSAELDLELRLLELHTGVTALLREFRPVVVCAEINEKIPPPVRFTVRYDPSYVWAVDHFYGQSVSTLHDLASANGYALVELHYNNAFLVPAELGVPGLSAEAAYREGYLERPDRLRVFPWNADMEALHSLDPQGQVDFLRAKFARYDGQYEIGL